jgi:hypothetical protein
MNNEELETLHSVPLRLCCARWRGGGESWMESTIVPTVFRLVLEG